MRKVIPFLASLLVVSCGDGADDPEAFVPDPAFHECDDGSPCPSGELCLLGVCVPEPSRDGSLGAEERNAEGKLIGVDKGVPPVLGCWADPPKVDAEPATVLVKGEVDAFGTGSDRNFPGLCVTVYDAEALLDHWRTGSRCPDLERTDSRNDCFSTDPCECDGLVGPQKDDCLADAGPAIAHALVADRSGAFELRAVPTNRPLVVKVSGDTRVWRDTYSWSSGARTDQLRDEDDQPWFRLDPLALSVPDWALLPTILNMAQKPDEAKGAIAGEIKDCGADGREPEVVIGAAIGLVADGSVRAFHNGNPEDDLGLDPERIDTAETGIFGILDVPAGPNRFVAAVRVGGQPRIAAAADLYVPPGAGIVMLVQGRAEWRERP